MWDMCSPQHATSRGCAVARSARAPEPAVLGPEKATGDATRPMALGISQPSITWKKFFYKLIALKNVLTNISKSCRLVWHSINIAKYRIPADLIIW